MRAGGPAGRSRSPVGRAVEGRAELALDAAGGADRCDGSDLGRGLRRRSPPACSTRAWCCESVRSVIAATRRRSAIGCPAVRRGTTRRARVGCFPSRRACACSGLFEVARPRCGSWTRHPGTVHAWCASARCADPRTVRAWTTGTRSLVRGPPVRGASVRGPPVRGPAGRAPLARAAPVRGAPPRGARGAGTRGAGSAVPRCS